MGKYVIDASVVLSYLLSEDKNIEKQVKNLLIKTQEEETELYSSKLLKLEVGNGLRFSLTDKNLAEKTYQSFLKLPIKYACISEVVYIKTLSVAFKYNTSFYDASYHLLAKTLKAQFLTCDKKYYKKAKSLGGIELVG